MALGQLPPWLQVTPRDFVLAAASGAQLGHQIASSTLQAWEEQARMRMAAQEAQANREQRAQQQAVDNAMARLAADRLEQYRQSEIANRQAELGLRGQGLDLQRQRNEDMYNLRDAALQAQTGREEDRQAYRDELNKFRDREADRKDKELDRRNREFEERQTTLQPHYFQQDGKQYMIPRGSTNAVPVDIPEDTTKDTSPTGDLLKRGWNYLFGSSPLSTNAAPAKGLSYAPQETQAAPAPSTNEVTRFTKDGRRAIFDADTKKFLRYAD